jgi:hypothetical protein
MADGNDILQLCFEYTVLVSLCSLPCPFLCSFSPPSPALTGVQRVSTNIPIEILTSTHSNQRITIRQRREYTDPASY